MKRLWMGPVEIWNHRHLWLTLTLREVQSRYRGSVLGMVWTILQPLLLLAAYTYVFSVVFQARWGTGEGGKTRFALALFAGLIPFNLIAEVLQRTPAMLHSQPNFVKKVIFPLSLLPLVSVGAASIQALLNLAVWFAFALVFQGSLSFSLLALPALALPVLLFACGTAWILTAIGVYFRDLQHIMGTGVALLLFITPIFYPVSALPAVVQKWIWLNPLTQAVDQWRNLLLDGHLPGWGPYLVWLATASAVAAFGLALFQSMRRGFADVL